MNYPKTLCKYSKFKSYSLGMIKSGYVYFSPANKLDDQFECLLNWNQYQSIVDDGNIDYPIKMVTEIMSEFGMNMPEIDFKQFFNKGVLNKDKALDFSTNEYEVEKDKADKVFNQVKDIQNMKMPSNLEETFKKVVLMQDYIGIFSMAENNDNQVMWSMYANNYNGYCIEYDIEKFLTNNPNYSHDLFKVKYEEKRNNDLIKELLRLFYSEMFKEMGIPNIINYNNDRLRQLIIDIAITKGVRLVFSKRMEINRYSYEY